MCGFPVDSLTLLIRDVNTYAIPIVHCRGGCVLSSVYVS